jgi:CheY-like chemotaxis protein
LYFSNQGLEVLKANSSKEALSILKKENIDFLILDLGLPDERGEKLLDILIEKGIEVKVVVYTGEEISPEKYQELTRKSVKIISKRTVDSFKKLEKEIINHFEKRKKLKTISSSEGKEVADIGVENTIENIDANNKNVNRGNKNFEVDNRFHEEKEEKKIDSFEIAKGKRVLLVDDDVRNIFATTALLEMLSMEVEVAKNGKEALEKFDDTFDLILLDLMMPEVDGYQVLEELKGKRKIKTPIIVLTAKALKGEDERVRKMGADGFLTKPLEKQKLIKVLRNIFV